MHKMWEGTDCLHRPPLRPHSAGHRCWKDPRVPPLEMVPPTDPRIRPTDSGEKPRCRHITGRPQSSCVVCGTTSILRTKAWGCTGRSGVRAGHGQASSQPRGASASPRLPTHPRQNNSVTLECGRTYCSEAVLTAGHWCHCACRRQTLGRLCRPVGGLGSTPAGT